MLRQDCCAAPGVVSAELTRHRYMGQFDACVIEFGSAGSDRAGNRDQVRELLALGGIRQIYWLLLADGAVTPAREIAEWWQQSAPLHQLGDVI